MCKSCRKLNVMLVTLLAASTLVGQGTFEQLAKALPAWLTNEGAVGVSAAIIDPTRSWGAVAGYSDRESSKPTQMATLFRLGSVSKQVAATAVMQLVDQGKLDIDLDVRNYVPNFPEPDGTVTLRQLLNHTSGVRHYALGKNESLYKFTPTEKALDMFVNDPRIGKPGEKFSYSTHAFTVVVAAIEKASEMKYTDYIRQNISQGTSLDCELLTDNKPARSMLYLKTKEAPRLETKREDNSWKFGGGGLESTAQDLAKFGVNVLNSKLVSEKSRDAMWTKQKTSDGKEFNYGLGWGLPESGLVEHSGGQQGCSCYLLIDTKRQVVVAVMCNTNSMNVGKLARDLLKAWK